MINWKQNITQKAYTLSGILKTIDIISGRDNHHEILQPSGVIIVLTYMIVSFIA